jgi:hypothetical protein
MESWKMNRPLRHLSILAILALAVNACGDNGVTDPDPTPLQVTLTPSSLELTVGETAELTVGVTGGPANASPTISCESSNTSAATASASGNSCVVQAVGAGSATVTANVQQGDQQASAEASVSVEEPAPEPSAVQVVSGDGQTLALEAESQTLVVRVEDQFGDPFPGAEVEFSSGGVEHTLSATSGATDDEGEAFVTVTAGQEPGTVNVVAAVEGAGSANFTLTVEAPEAATIERVAGDGQTLGFEDTSMGLVVRVEDQFGRPFRDAEVQFTGSGVAHTLSASSVNTDPDGEAAITVTSGTEEGEITVEAGVDGVGSVTFTLDVESDAEPTVILALAGDAQTLDHNVTSAALVVQVNDQYGAPFPGTEVTFNGSGVAHTLSSTSGTTDGNGRASVTVTAGTEDGTITVTAEAAGVGSVDFTLTVEEDVPEPEAAEIVIVSGNGQTLDHNETSAALVVQVNDQYDDPFPGADVTFSGSGVPHNLSSTSETTDGSGQASVTVEAGTEDGTITVEVSVDGTTLTPVTFTLTVEEDPDDPEAAEIVIVSGNGQTLDHNETSAALVVQVNDQYDDPFPGADVTFSGSGVPHNLSSTSETTDGSGQASVTVEAGTEDGTITVEVSVDGTTLTPVTFTLAVEGSTAPTTFATNFSGNTVGAFPDDWTDRGLLAAANSITVESDNGDNVLRIDLPDQDPSVHRGISWDVPGTWADVRVEATLVPGSGSVPAYITARGTADDTYYRLQLRHNEIEILSVVDGDHLPLPLPGGSASFSSSSSSTVHLEFEVEGDQLRARAWLSSESKPANWMIEITNSDITAPGWTGVGRLHEGVTNFLDFAVTPLD